MKGFLSLNSPFFKLIEKAFDLAVLTFLWAICCIPVITAGASTSALFYVTQRMVRNEETYVWKNFFHGFKINFGQATKLWLAYLPIGAFLAFDWYAYLGPMKEKMPTWGLPVLAILSFDYILMFLYTYCMQSRYTLSIKQIMKNCLILLVSHLKYTLTIGITVVLMVVCIVLNKWTMIAGVLLGPALIVYVVSLFMMKIFDPLERGEGQENESADGEGTAEAAEEAAPQSVVLTEAEMAGEGARNVVLTEADMAVEAAQVRVAEAEPEVETEVES